MTRSAATATPGLVLSPAPATPAASAAGGGATGPLGVLLAMCDVLSQAQLVELERMLSARLQPPTPTPAQERVAELFALTQALESALAFSLPHHPIAPVQVTQRAYDETRPEGAPAAETLSDRYGGPEHDGWEWACRAAWGLLPDGRKRKPGPLFAQRRGRRRAPRGGREYVIASIRTCAFAILRRPSSHAYDAWRRHRVRASRGIADAVRETNPAYYAPASFDILYSRYADGWASALADAHITDEELADARARHAADRMAAATMGASMLGMTHVPIEDVAAAAGRDATDLYRQSAASRQDAARALVQAPPTVADRLLALDDKALGALRLSHAQRDRLARKGCGAIGLSDALRLAHGLGVSLDCLGGGAGHGGESPEEGIAFSPDRLREHAEQQGVRLTALYAQAKLDIGHSRRLMAGTIEPTLGQLVALAEGVRATPVTLCQPTSCLGLGLPTASAGPQDSSGPDGGRPGSMA